MGSVGAPDSWKRPVSRKVPGIQVPVVSSRARLGRWIRRVSCVVLPTFLRLQDTTHPHFSSILILRSILILGSIFVLGSILILEVLLILEAHPREGSQRCGVLQCGRFHELGLLFAGVLKKER